MISLYKYYPPIKLDELYKYMEVFLPLVTYTQGLFGIDSKQFQLDGDHIGVQVLTPEGFDAMHSNILEYADLIHAGVIHDRRNNIYKFKSQFTVGDITIEGLEIFEPKPGADISKLKAGVEHVAFYTPVFDELHGFLVKNNIPIDKFVEENNSKFVKTRLLNLVEIEYRNDRLGVLN